MGYSVLELGHGLPKHFGLGQMRIIVLVKVLVMQQKFQGWNFISWLLQILWENGVFIGGVRLPLLSSLVCELINNNLKNQNIK